MIMRLIMEETNYPDYKTIFEKDLAEIIYQIKHYYPHFNDRQEKKISRAFWFAEEAHRNQERFSGKPYFTHPIAATKILLQIKPDIETVCACLMHDVIEDTEITADDLERKFGKKIRFLCEGVEKITKVRFQGKEREVESLRKLFVAMAKDIRVIFIKLADRIHNLRTLEFVNTEKQVRIAKESMEIYVPVADRLGIFEFKTLMEDLCFKYLHAEEYQKITQQIKKSKEARQAYIDVAKKELRKLLTKAGINFEKLEGRDKNLYSVYSKLKRKNYSHVSEVHDLLAIRIIVSDIADCYRTLGLIHSHWKPIPGRFKDYIAVSKPNGYQSIHTTILGIAKSKIPTEIQIRTMKMHTDAELGPAAHWLYKQRKNSNFDKNYIKKTQWFPEKLSEFSQIKSPEQFFDTISESLAAKRIHVLTPKGDIKNLPAKATPIDFAYAIHTDIGNRCFGAKVNGNIRPLDYELKGGDMVEILTNLNRKPNPAWLSFVKSSSAKQKIQQFINQQKAIHEPAPVEEEKIRSKPISQRSVLASPLPFVPKDPKNFSEFAIIIGGESGLGYHLAPCCEPAPGKKITAYNSRGREFVVHQSSCKTLKGLSAERFLDAEFVREKRISILAKDRLGLLKDWYDIFTTKGIFVWEAKFKRLKNRLVQAKYTVHIKSEDSFKNAILALQNVKNVMEVKTENFTEKKG